MAKTEYLKFEGLASYAKVYTPDEYKGSKFWRLNLHPTDGVIQKIKDSGIQTKLHDSNEEFSNVPGKFFKFRRDCEKDFGKEVKKFMPPRIVDKNKKTLVDYKEQDGEIIMIGEKVLIGNGSKVEVTLEVYDAGRFGKGCRLLEVRIIDLIEYIPPDEAEKLQEDAGAVEEKPKKSVSW